MSRRPPVRRQQPPAPVVVAPRPPTPSETPSPAPTVKKPSAGDEERGDIASAYSRRDYQAVVDKFAGLQERYPSNVKGRDDLYYLGLSNFYLGNGDRALRSLLEFQYRFPSDRRVPEAIYITARIYRAMGREERALDILRQVVGKSSSGEIFLLAVEEKADILAGQGYVLDSLSVLDSAYLSADGTARERLLLRIKELLKLLPPATLLERVILGGYGFPIEAAEEIYREAKIDEPAPPEAPAVEPDSPLSDRLLVDDLREREGEFLSREGELPVRKIGVMIPFEGRLKSYGRDVRRGVDLLLESLPPTYPYRLEPVYIDEECSDCAATLARTVASEDLLMVIGPLLSSTVEKIVPFAEEAGLPLLSPTASSPRLAGISPYFFRNCLTIEDFGRALVAFAMDVLGLKSFAVFAPDDVYGFHYSDVLQREVTARGGILVAAGSYEVSLTDFSKPIALLKKAAGIPDPLPVPEEGEEGEKVEEYVLPFEGLFLPGYAEQAGLIVPQLAFHEIDVRKIAILGGNALNTPRFPEVGEEFAEGVFFTDGFFAGSARREVQRFVADYRREYGEDPGTFPAQSYDAAAIAADIIGRGAATRRAVFTALGEVRDYAGVTGAVTLSAASVRRPFFGAVIRNRLVSVDFPLVLTEKEF